MVAMNIIIILVIFLPEAARDTVNNKLRACKWKAKSNFCLLWHMCGELTCKRGESESAFFFL